MSCSWLSAGCKDKEKGCFTAILDASPRVLAALTELGEDAEPSVVVVTGCEQFLYSLCCPKQLHKSQTKTLGGHLFKQLKPDQGVNKRPPTPGV